MIILFGDWIRNIALFVIFSALIELLMPENHFRKYIHMILGLILMLILIRPITSIFWGKHNTFENLIEINQLEMDRQSILKQSSDIASKQEELIFETYKINLGEQIRKLIEKNTDLIVNDITIIVNEDKKDKEYGVIQAVDMTVAKKEETNSKVIGIVPIKPIEINTNKKEKQNKKEAVQENEMEKNIKKLLINFYNLSSDNIYITVQKK